MLRWTEAAGSIGHITTPLATLTAPAGGPQSPPPAPSSERERCAIEGALARRGAGGRVEDGALPGRYRVRYDVTDAPLVSIVLLTKDKTTLLRKCVESLRDKTAYRNFEVTLVHHHVGDEAEKAHEAAAALGLQPIDYTEPFNYSRMNNLAVARTRGDYVLLLNDDIEVIDGGWLEAMLEQAQRPGVGIVGARLLYPNGSVQHDGVVVGREESAAHIDFDGYFGLDACIRNQSAVTGACVLLRRSLYDEVGGLDEALPVVYNDIDLCLKLRARGYRVVITPYATLYHHEMATRRRGDPPEDMALFRSRWPEARSPHDPYFSDHLHWWPARIITP
jgi:glycosyltransferase involved in cell wall biosynthesis